jgi:hypothetical protein
MPANLFVAGICWGGPPPCFFWAAPTPRSYGCPAITSNLAVVF